ncbi:MAG: hypothetical protein IT383_21240 [Deltaproteobacteria bacterium]|nr:hypothetical protein [Deltaproteobacteria bacterium]
MSDLASLGLVIVALTLAECAWWVRHGAVVLRAPWYVGRGALATLSSSLGNERGAFAFMNPLPPFGRAYVLEPWPFSISEEGVVNVRSFSFAHEHRPAGRPVVVAWDAVETLARDDASVLVNGAPFATCASKHHAEAARRALQAMKDAKPKDRARVLEEIIEAHLDPEQVSARTREHRSAGVSSLIGAFGLFVALFGALPVEVAQRGLERWQWLVTILYAWVALVAVATWTVHRVLYGKRAERLGASRGERVAQLVMMVLAPYTALRATDKVGRNLLAGCHPIAAALALADTRAGRDAVLRALRDVQSPRPLVLDDGARAIEASFRARLAKVAKKKAEGRGVEVSSLADPPPLRAGQLAWCPRCRTPYRQASGTCADCQVPLSSTT